MKARTGMTIGKLAKRAGISTDAIRFYEDEGILLPTEKTEAGYRLYGDDAVRRLSFIKHAKQCGMTLSEIRQLLNLKANDRSCCSDVRSLAIRKKLQLEQKIKTMTAMSQTLSELIEICTLEDRPLDDCPILAALESRLKEQDRESNHSDDRGPDRACAMKVAIPPPLADERPTTTTTSFRHDEI